MEDEKLYKIAKRRHQDLNRDVIHDLYVKFGSELPSDAYVVKCISHAKPQPMQQRFDTMFLQQPQEYEESESILLEVSQAVNSVRDKYELEVDTFLECHVNGSYKSFEQRSGIARSILEKICKFAQYEILKEFNRIRALD